MGEPSPSSSFLALLFNTVFYMKNNPKYTFGDRIFVKNEEAEVLGIWRARGGWYYKVQSQSKNPNIDALWWLEAYCAIAEPLDILGKF